MRSPAAKAIGRRLLQSLLFSILSPAPPAAGQLPPGTPAVPAAVAAGQAEPSWRVQYVGGPEPIKRSAPVEVTVGRDQITYRQVGGRSGPASSIPVAGITGVSGELIEGRSDDKAFGDGEPDRSTPCGEVDDPLSAIAFCATPLVVLGSLKGILRAIPYKDRFVRIAWREPGGANQVAVFRVPGKDYAPFLEAVEHVTPKLDDRPPEDSPAPSARASSSPAGPSRADQASSDELFQQWWERANPAGGSIKSTAQRVPLLSLGTPPATESKAHDLLLAQPEGH